LDELGSGFFDFCGYVLQVIKVSCIGYGGINKAVWLSGCIGEGIFVETFSLKIIQYFA
jgi:hypothetical protein